MPEPVGIAGSERRVGVRGFCYSLRVASWPLVRGTDSQILPSLVAVFFCLNMIYYHHIIVDRSGFGDGLRLGNLS